MYAIPTRIMLLLARKLHKYIVYVMGATDGRAKHEADPQLVERSEQLCVEAFVLEVKESTAIVGITKVLEDHGEEIELDPKQRFWGTDGYRSADYYSPLFESFPEDYRSLLEITKRLFSRGYSALDGFDSIDINNCPQIRPGDSVRITTEFVFVRNGRDSRSGSTEQIVEILPKPNQPDIISYIKRSEERKIRLAKQLMRTIAKREQMDMSAQSRIVPNRAVRPFEDTGSRQVRYVFGDGPVKDHYVDISARSLRSGNTGLRGDKCFTNNRETGESFAYFVPYHAPLGFGEPDEELYEIDISISSQTAHSPAVGEQTVVISADGEQYDMYNDPYETSQIFENPGHHIVSGGFMRSDGAPNASVITPEQLQASNQLSELEHSIVMKALYTALGQGIDFIKDPHLVEDIEQSLRQNPDVAEEIKHLEAIVQSIHNNPLTEYLHYGSTLVLPESLLDAIELVMPSLHE
jgi:hypothetical protein